MRHQWSVHMSGRPADRVRFQYADTMVMDRRHW